MTDAEFTAIMARVALAKEALWSVDFDFGRDGSFENVVVWLGRPDGHTYRVSIKWFPDDRNEGGQRYRSAALRSLNHTLVECGFR